MAPKASRWQGSVCLGVWCLCFGGTALAPAQQSDSADQQRRERLQSLLHGVVLEGFFTVVGDSPDPPQLRQERYEIRSAKPLAGDTWLFESRITYGEHDLTAPLPLPVRWSGDTPVIHVDSVTIPGLGTFSARVVFDGDRYAGTWQHDKVGGHLFGRIRKADAESTPPSPEPGNSSK